MFSTIRLTLIALAIVNASYQEKLLDPQARTNLKLNEDTNLIEEAKKTDSKNMQRANIVAGGGYSSDSQQMAPQACYDATMTTSGQQGYIKLDTALSYSELENELGISVGASAKFGMFSVDAQASYMKSIQDKDYSLSLNYYQYTTNNVAVQLKGSGINALTKVGQEIYNEGKNPQFRLICGDQYITEFQQGALLTMGLNIKFSSAYEKTVFEEKASASFLGLVSVSESVKTVASTYKLSGSVSIQAFQMGGDPTQLANILSSDGAGNYYATSCSLDNMNACISAASGILDYAKNTFTTQISFEENKGLTPLGVAFTKYYPVEYVGLIPPPSLVTPEVENIRSQLSEIYEESQYYQQKLYPFVSGGYPVQLQASVINSAKAAISKSTHNANLLLQAHNGAADCFNFPDRCQSILDGINSQLQNITKTDISFVEDLKYIMTADMNMYLYNTGGQSDLTSSWTARLKPDDYDDYLIVDKLISATVTETSYSYYVSIASSTWNYKLAKYDARRQGTSDYYVGALYDDGELYSSSYTENRFISPFYFYEYSAYQSKAI